MLPAFPTLLAELSPHEVFIIDTIYGKLDFSEPMRFGTVPITWPALLDVTDLSLVAFTVSMENLARSGVCELVVSPTGTIAAKFGMEEPPLVATTAFGASFFLACSRPPGVQEPSADLPIG